MWDYRSILTALFFTLWGTVGTQALEPVDLENPAILEAFSDGFVLPLMKKHNSPSGVVTVIKNGEAVLAKGYGYQNLDTRRPVDPAETLFRPGSISKLFTWVSVMQLVEQNKLDLDVDVNQYLTQLQIKDTFPGEPVTMRHIMTHTAGFEDGGVGYLIVEEPENIVPLATALAKYQPERVTAPGAQTAYSNYATALAGLIVSNISGLSFEDYVQAQIFDKLGMDTASFLEPLPEPLQADLATAYAFDGGQQHEMPFEIISNFGPAGSLSATAADMEKFAQAILGGGANQHGRILEEKTLEQTLARQFTHDDRMMGMAHGFYETERQGQRVVGHSGNTFYFHSDFGVDLKNGLAYFVSFSGTEGAEISYAFAPAFYASFFPQEQAVVTPPTDFAARAEKYVGNYLFWRTNFSHFEKTANLFAGMSIDVSDGNTLIIDDEEFVEIDNNLFQKVGGQQKLAFQENAEGEITGFVVDGMPFMSTFKAPFYYASGFNYLFLTISIMVFAGVLARAFYQRHNNRDKLSAERGAEHAALYVAGANMLTLVLGILIISAVSDRFEEEIPFAFTLWLLFPFMVLLTGFYQAYQTYVVWRDGLLTNIWTRLRFSVVTLCALFMCWFYYFWNLLGFKYFS